MVDLAKEATKAKVLKDYERFRRIKKILIDYRLEIENELRVESKGLWPPPHIVMDKLLEVEPSTKNNNLSSNIAISKETR